MSANGAAHDHSSGSPRGDGLRVPTSPTSGAHKPSNTGGGASQPRPSATEKPATAPPGAAGAASGSPAPAAAEHYVDVAPTADGGLTGEVLAKWRTSMELLPRYVATSKVVVFVSDLLVRQTLLLDLTLRHHESHKTGRKSVFDLITTNEDVFRTQRLARVLLKAGSPTAPRNLPDVGVVIHFEPPDTDAYVRRLSWAPKGVSILLLMPSQTEVVAALKGAGRNLSVLPGAPGQANAKTGWGEGAETSSTPQPTLSELSDPRPGVSDLLRALGTFPSPPLTPAPQQASKPAHTPSQSHSHTAKSASHPPQQPKKPAAVKAQEAGEAAVGGGEGKGGAADAEGAQQHEQAGAGGGEDEVGDAEGGAADGEGEKRENGWQTVTAQKERNVRGNHDLGDGSIGKARLDVKKQVRVGDELNGEVLAVQRGESRGGGEGGDRQQTQRQVLLRVGKPEGVYSEEARLTPTIELPVGEKLRVRVVTTDKGAKGTHIRVTPATEFPVGDSELDLSRLRKFDVLNGLVLYPLDNRGVTLRVGTPDGFYPIRATILQWPPKVRIGQGIKVEVRHIREDKSYIKVQQVDPDLLIARTPELLPQTLEVGKVLNACAYTQNDTTTFLRIGTTEGMYVAHGVLPKDIGLVPIGERAKVEVTGINEEAGGRLSVNLKLHKPT